MVSRLMCDIVPFIYTEKDLWFGKSSQEKNYQFVKDNMSLLGTRNGLIDWTKVWTSSFGMYAQISPPMHL